MCSHSFGSGAALSNGGSAAEGEGEFQQQANVMGSLTLAKAVAWRRMCGL
ncbi:hypothetical protein B0H99_102245 [Planomicrobium soli]|uniref:Uncharacterized protein n=1 Tax=Planomicrobium soli TaxID=1176648 RepID=A0A2P8H5S8_9BACL|nr:hypothetical protein [Planomicrobium soli]PSL41561.1 hypothetical protein B0H99_102245 [Planomicrobium soli]